MKNKIFTFLKNYSTQPLMVDRLIISAYLQVNDLTVKKNEFLLIYFIRRNDKEEYESLLTFITVIKEALKDFTIEDLIELFEFVVSPSDKILNGAIYTPLEIREYIVQQTLNSKETIFNTVKIADIACGCSGFLSSAAKELKKKTGKSYYHVFKEQIFGLDIQNYSITRSKLLLSILALSEGEDEKEFQFNLYQGDALIFKWQDHFKDFSGFEVIVGNPPYVCARNLDDEVKQNLKHWSVCKTGNPDLYIPFFEIGFENLSQNGTLGFITMNTFFKSLNGGALREYFKQNAVSIEIIDFGTYQIFKSKSTYTCICFIKKVKQDYLKYFKSNNKNFPEKEGDYSKISYNGLDSKKGWNLKDNKIISKIESTGTPFGDTYTTRHGIATLRNDIFIFKPIDVDDNFYYLQNGSVYPIEKGICKDILNSNKLSRKVDLESVKEKVIFPYTEGEKPKAIEEEDFKDLYPNAFKYLNKKKEELSNRDKGKGKYEKWFAFGRTQSLEKITNKLFFPKMTDRTPHFIINSDQNLLFYNGQAIIGHSQREMKFIKKIMESRLFWYYIKTTSKPYSSNYYSLNGNYIQNFGIYNFCEQEIDFILNEKNEEYLNAFIEDKYKVKISSS